MQYQKTRKARKTRMESTMTEQMWELARGGQDDAAAQGALGVTATEPERGVRAERSFGGLGARAGSMAGVGVVAAMAGAVALMLGAMMQSKGRLYAFDVSSARVARLGPRLRRSGLSNLHPEVISSENDTRVKRLAGKVDRVLVDAPCSGFGTLRRNPDLRYRHSPVSITELVAKQTGILRAAARLVRPGGRLVYATCSLLPEENQAIVDDFLANDPSFALLNAKDILARSGIDVADQSNDCLQLWPHHHRTDGFFAAVLEKKAAPAPAKGEEGAVERGSVKRGAVKREAVKQGSVEEARDKGPAEAADVAPAEAAPVEAAPTEAAPVEAAPVEAALKEEASADEAPAEAAVKKAPPKVAPAAKRKRTKKA